MQTIDQLNDTIRRSNERKRALAEKRAEMINTIEGYYTRAELHAMSTTQLRKLHKRYA